MQTTHVAKVGYENYEHKKDDLVIQLAQFSQKEETIRIYKQTSNLFRHRQKSTKGIDVRHFNKVIAINPEELTADVEGMTTYETLVTECLKYNCLPTVVPELKSITIGGALTGGAIESSSFRFGLVHETITEFEVLLSNGTIVLCKPDNEHKDLFYGFPNSYGTLGYALRVKVKLRRIKPFVKLTHLHFTKSDIYFKQMQELCLNNRENEQYSFIEGVIFKPDEMYITVGELVMEAPFISDYTFMQMYYKSIKQRKEDYLSVLDYIWRWDTDWFWCSKFFYLQNPILRFLMGKKRLKSATYWRLRHFFGTNPAAKFLLDRLSQKTESVIQDVQIPMGNAEKFYEFFQQNIKIRPIWCCPTMPYQRDVTYDLYPMSTDTLFVNFGFWDVVPTTKEKGYYNRLIEKEVALLNGKKSLYSDVYYPEDEFWSIFNKESYGRLKEKYDPNLRLRTLYQKCIETGSR